MPGTSTRKKAVNLSIDANLVAEAKLAGLNLSAVLEGSLAQALQQTRLEAWQKENRSAITAYNKFIEENGLLSDEWPAF